MAEVKPESPSCSEDAVQLVGEASSSGEAGSTSSGSVPPSIAAEPPSFLTWMWIQILTACSGVWGTRGGGSSRPRVSGLASGAQPHTLEDSESEALSRIAASKSTWSEVPGRQSQHSVSVPGPSELSVWEELKASAPDFFGVDWLEGLEIGRLIAEGGQAQIYEAKGVNFVFKVFKLDAGFSLSDLKRHWPLRVGEGCNECTSMQEKGSGFVFEDLTSNMYGYRCVIVGATLLRDGRFAFFMQRYWGDLRMLIDLQVERRTHPWEFDLLSKNSREQPPFSLDDSRRIMLQIAKGMHGLHALDVLHRDLKAANVLMRGGGLDCLDCNVADYECAMFVQGTGFWRAPEVLQELQKKSEDRNDDIWTKKVDVYSFGMTCYEILTGQIPFDGYTKSKWNDVIQGERPSLPTYVHLRLRKLVEACWHAQPSQRPSFDDIVGELFFYW